jgi:hypothetical protein
MNSQQAWNIGDCIAMAMCFWRFHENLDHPTISTVRHQRDDPCL